MIAQNESQVDLNVYNNNIGLAGGVAYPADSKPEHMAVEEIVLSNRSSHRDFNRTSSYIDFRQTDQ
jgi:hypothetical protein